jgi:hypothetical protein
MNIFENYKATKLYIELLDGFENDENEALADLYRNRIKEYFLEKVNSDVDLDSYKISVEEVQHIADEISAEDL